MSGTRTLHVDMVHCGRSFLTSPVECLECYLTLKLGSRFTSLLINRDICCIISITTERSKCRALLTKP